VGTTETFNFSLDHDLLQREGNCIISTQLQRLATTPMLATFTLLEVNALFGGTSPFANASPFTWREEKRNRS